MNKSKHIIAFALVLIFALSMPVSAFAATHSVGTKEEMKDAFDDGETNITITLTANITMAEALTAKTGKIIVINGGTYILQDVQFVGDTATGGGTVTVNADIQGTDNNAALTTSNGVTVKVTGDVTGGANTAANGTAGDAVVTNDTSKVTVTGDVTGGANSGKDGTAGTAVVTNDTSTVTVTGDVTGGANTAVDGDTAGNAVVATDSSTVAVTGDVTGGANSGKDGNAGAGVYAQNDTGSTTGATVTVTGDVSGGANSGESGGAGVGVVAADNTAVTVTGDVSGGDNSAKGGNAYFDEGVGIMAGDTSSVTVTGNVEGGDSTQLAETSNSANGGSAVLATSEASVTVTGNADGGDGAGYEAHGGMGAAVFQNASVSVGGNTTGGDVVSKPSSSYTGAVNAQAGDGLYVAPEAHATVTGNVTGGSTDAGDAGNGIVLLTVTPVTTKPGDVVVGGTVTGGTTSDPKGENGAALYLEIGTGVTSLTDGSTANISAWKLSDASGKMVEASDATMQAKAEEYVAKKVIYPVYVAQPKNGTISVSTASGVAGTKVTVTVKWDKDANLTKFKGIFYGSGQAREISKNTYEFVIPSGGGVIVYAGFEIPQTGDSADLSLWLGLMLLSSTAFAYPLLRRRKEQ